MLDGSFPWSDNINGVGASHSSLPFLHIKGSYAYMHKQDAATKLQEIDISHTNGRRENSQPQTDPEACLTAEVTSLSRMQN